MNCLHCCEPFDVLATGDHRGHCSQECRYCCSGVCVHIAQLIAKLRANELRHVFDEQVAYERGLQVGRELGRREPTHG